MKTSMRIIKPNKQYDEYMHDQFDRLRRIESIIGKISVVAVFVTLFSFAISFIGIVKNGFLTVLLSIMTISLVILLAPLVLIGRDP